MGFVWISSKQEYLHKFSLIKIKMKSTYTLKEFIDTLQVRCSNFSNFCISESSFAICHNLSMPSITYFHTSPRSFHLHNFLQE